MDYLNVLLATTFSVIEIIILTKLIGYRQIGELSIYDYINSITFGSIAADMATAQGEHFYLLAFALLLFGIYTYLFAIFTDKSRRFRKCIIGTPLILYKNDTISYPSLKKAHLDLSEFLSTLRSMDVFYLDEVSEVILETNGKFSIKKKKQKASIILIKECEVLPDSLTLIHQDQTWLENALKEKGFSLQDVFLSTYSASEGLIIYEKKSGKRTKIL